MIQEVLAKGFAMVSEFQDAQDREKEQILKEWGDSMKLSRRKKKALRKELLFRWSLANIDLFPGIHILRKLVNSN